LHEKKLGVSGSINKNLVADIIAKKRELESQDEKDESYRPESKL
jgi:hypothetical protein